MRQNIFLLLITIPVFCHSQEINTEIDLFMNSQMQESGIPGIAYSVIRNNQIDHIAAIGKANIEFDEIDIKGLSRCDGELFQEIVFLFGRAAFN